MEKAGKRRGVRYQSLFPSSPSSFPPHFRSVSTLSNNVNYINIPLLSSPSSLSSSLIPSDSPRSLSQPSAYSNTPPPAATVAPHSMPEGKRRHNMSVESHLQRAATGIVPPFCGFVQMNRDLVAAPKRYGTLAPLLGGGTQSHTTFRT